ncbi:hypothetical protein [Lacticaseibacillus absianus]|uniref:hypothetical protein n=1 Tax=Lacticaseibacillus absianus TaxID=2729623 RepID=UPI001FEC3778|nr:hypothetical protein [Lacticaseibacillus absianus]
MDLKFEEFQHVDHDLAAREFELRYPWRPTDTNVGGGRSAMRPDGADRTLAAIEDDPRIIYLRRLKNACETVISRMSDDQFEVYKIRYCSMVNYHWADIETIAPFSHGAVYRYRYGILSALAKELGELT